MAEDPGRQGYYNMLRHVRWVPSFALQLSRMSLNIPAGPCRSSGGPPGSSVARAARPGTRHPRLRARLRILLDLDHLMISLLSSACVRQPTDAPSPSVIKSRLRNCPLVDGGTAVSRVGSLSTPSGITKIDSLLCRKTGRPANSEAKLHLLRQGGQG